MRSKQLFTSYLSPLPLALTSALMLSSGITHAMQCDQLFEDPVSDEYYDLERPRTDKKTLLELNDLADQLNGRWHGTGIEVDCGISDGTPLTTIENFNIDAEIEQHFRGSIIVRAQKENKDIVQLENLFISPDNKRELETIQQGYEPHPPSYSIEFSSPNTLVFDHKYRTTNAAPTIPNVFVNSSRVEQARRVVHEIKTVSLENDQLTIFRDVYVNGIFVSQQEWQLTKL